MCNTRNTTRSTTRNSQFAGFLGEQQRVTLHFKKYIYILFKSLVLRVLRVVIYLKNLVSLVLNVVLRVVLRVLCLVTQG